MMLFRKKMPRNCTYCQHGTAINNEEILCVKRGVVSINRVCRKFTYDPCKRVPVKAKAADFTKYDNEDFSL